MAIRAAGFCLFTLLTLAPAGADDLGRLGALLEGAFDNRAQWEAAGKPGPTIPDRHLRLDARIEPLSNSPDDAFPMALRLVQIQDAFAPHLYRDAVLLLRARPDGAIIMRVRAVARAEAVDDRRMPEAVLQPADAGCDLIWRADGRGFTGTTLPQACRVLSRRLGVELVRDEIWTVDGDALTQFERTLDPDGRILHESPRGLPYVMNRVTKP